MQSWQIKALELEDTALKHLDGFAHEHALYFLIGIIYLLLALLVWVLSGALRPKSGKPLSHVRPAIIIHLPGTPPPAPGESFDPFPALRDPPDCHYDCDDFDWD
jgi:hypothetical protein